MVFVYNDNNDSIAKFLSCYLNICGHLSIREVDYFMV